MNNTATKQPRLIPYPVIEAAIAGETDAVNEVIRHYAIIIPKEGSKTAFKKD